MRYGLINTLLISSLTLLCICGIHAATIYVPADYPSIGEAVAAARDGDTVMVADGTYRGINNMGIVIWNIHINVISENGPVNCIVDGEDLWRFVEYREGTDDCVLRGFTFRNFAGDCET